jgi:hypothetical protein
MLNVQLAARFVLGTPPQLPGTGKQHVDGHADKRILRDPLTLSPALAVERPAYPGQLVELVFPGG